jgi:hypothetical protein
MWRVEHPTLFIVFVFLIVSWIGLSLIGMLFAAVVYYDARKDIKAREESHINSGRETLAKLVRKMGAFKFFAYILWFLSGVYVLTPWSLNSTGPEWRRLIVPFCMNTGITLVTLSLVNFHWTRRNVLERDMKDTKVQEEAMAVTAALLAAKHLDRNTDSMNRLKDATDKATVAVQKQTAAMEDTKNG